MGTGKTVTKDLNLGDKLTFAMTMMMKYDHHSEVASLTNSIIFKWALHVEMICIIIN